MFYGNIILGKKGPLAKLWLAAHWEKKLSKAHVFETDLPSAVDNLISPTVKIALRTSGHLLLGVVRIYSRKTKYLLADCSEAFVKIKMAFRPGLVDLPEDNREAAVSAITLPEFQEWDAIVNDLTNFDLHAQITLNQSRVEEITMKEDLIGTNFILDDNFFGDTPFGEVNENEMRDGASFADVTEKELLREASAIGDTDFQESDISKVSIMEDENQQSKQTGTAFNEKHLVLEEAMQEEGFGMGEGLDFLDAFQEGDGVVPDLEELLGPSRDNNATDPTLEPLDGSADILTVDNQDQKLDSDEAKEIPDVPDDADVAVDQTTLIVNQEEEFALDPIDDAAFGKKKSKRRKRKLVVDDEKILKGDQIRAQLEDTSDIVVAASVAPPTKLRMRLMETSTVKYLFSMPSVEMYSEMLLAAYTRNLTSKPVEDLEGLNESESEKMEVDMPELEALEPVHNVDEIEGEEEVTESPDLVDNEQVPPPEEISTVDNLFVDVTQGLTVDPDEGNIDNAESIADTEKSREFDEDDELIDDKDDDAQERRWTKRTHQTLNMLEREFKRKDKVNFSRLNRKNNRKQAACLFSTILILKRENGILTEQNEAYCDIVISKGPRFDELL